ncbi:MAG: sigma-70 family RNA polymerase sigma factor [Deltaproteobacteria bacterium]|nr:sigma-70 family RNA polymerase sigma factor [Deltaproteobacteria bacterium]
MSRPALTAGAAAAIAPERLVRDHWPRAYRHALRRLGDHHEAEDIAQEAMIAAYSSLDSFRGESTLSSWVLGITRNVIGHRLRRKRLNTVELREARHVGAETVAGDDRLDTKRRMQATMSAIDRLQPQLRETLVLRTVEGKSTREVAGLTGRTETTVKTHLYRARKALKAEIQKRFVGGSWRTAAARRRGPPRSISPLQHRAASIPASKKTPHQTQRSS